MVTVSNNERMRYVFFSESSETIVDDALIAGNTNGIDSTTDDENEFIGFFATMDGTIDVSNSEFSDNEDVTVRIFSFL